MTPGRGPNQHQVPRKKWDALSVLLVGGATSRPRETWEGSRGPPVPSTLEFVFPGLDNQGHLRTRFAMRFGDQDAEDSAEPTRADQVRSAFNSPFWPFVLATTSVGQEGLDFHSYCHAVVHWNLPSNPVDLEQREGRVHRV